MTERSTRDKSLSESAGWWRSRLLILLTGFGLTLAVAMLSVFPPVTLQKADLFVYDQLLASRAMPPQSAEPVLVGIDEESLAAFGQWPWPRYRLAMLVERLQSLGAGVIALDFLMPESDRTSPEVIRQERRRDLVEPAAAASPNETDSNSQRLARAMAQSPVVLGYYLDFVQPGNQDQLRPPPAAPDGMVVARSAENHPARRLPPGQIRSLPMLTKAAAAEGFTNAQEDIDGSLRRVPLLLAVDGREYPSLAFAALLAASQERQLHLLTDHGENVLRWGQRTIPLDAAGNLLLDFRSMPHQPLSALSVLRGELPPESLRGRIVLVGAWAKGLGDQHRTALGGSVSGLDVHATVIDNILAGTFVMRPNWARGVELACVLMAGLLATLLLSRSGFVVSSVTMIIGTIGFYWGARQLMISQGIHLSPLLPMLALVLISTALSLLKYGIEAHKLRLRTQDLLDAQDEIIVAMSVLAEARDKETGGHILRTQRYVEILARQLAASPRYASLTPFDIELLAKSAPLHDIGKVGIPDSILQKPGKLTEAEYGIMQSHTLIGAEALARVVGGSGHPEKQSFLDYARQMTESHHEHWDGRGYPHQLQGENIPLAGRLMALADVYDALISRRVYKKPFTHAEVCDFILQKAGTQFDPEVVAAFVARNAEFYQVAQEFADPVE
ncbi:CHASE2 domain-containing protein [Ferribacterium limneticum]|uniref:CHASE2 domain-containing protein n=1 Tax=Ferribacterium limneticum TaxID=76259 RepID=UPI001CFB7B65|nr:CHASE2 domain-containing protein [Ferribacterium limneticum]UCV28130.1 CHASE2 domain-containing protein [Ferribacterium limneticum]UCV32047.1 CHASE2 domain-containing protein [Ferribacterium limneticum]